MIIDKVTVYLRSGRGGEGNESLMRLSSRKAISSGGDGGKGADVILKVSPHLYDLSKFRGTKKFIAFDGGRGRERNKKGKDAEDLIVPVPCGTRVLENDKVIADLVKEEDEFLICKGGQSGKGNNKRDFTLPPGEGEEREVTLDYRIPNDVAILGFANSGKTSLFNALTGQNSKVAHYPFTTIHCFWSKYEYEFKEFTVLDAPPFKRRKEPGQDTRRHQGYGGQVENKFLRHIFRSKILLLLSDNHANYIDDFSQLKNEILLFDSTLLENKKIFYLMSKVDKITKSGEAKDNIQAISVEKGQGIEELKDNISKELNIV